MWLEVIELPYVGDSLSMFIILPDRGTTLAELENSLTFDDLVNVRQKFQMRLAEVRLFLPKFRLDERLSLVQLLAAMGMRDLFTRTADLSGIDGSRELCVSEVLHRAVVEVNEEGTEAAAAAAMGVMVFGSASMYTRVFCADRPFLFFIQHRATKSILFLGRLVKPPTVQ